MAQLRTRKPTGLIPFPLIVIGGAEKSGKSYSAFALSASEKVGRTFVFDIGEGGADEYAELGPYEVVDHDGTYNDIVAQLEAACAVPFQDGKPNVIVFDSATNFWDLLKDEATRTAGAKGHSDNIPMKYWNTANDKWRRVINPLIRFPGIAVITARAGDVAEVVGGVPVANSKVWKIQAQKGLGYDANVVIRTTGPGQAEIVGVRSLKLRIPADKALPVPGFTLEKVIFDMVKANGGIRDLKSLSTDAVPPGNAKKELVDAYLGAGWPEVEATEKAKAAWNGRGSTPIPRTDLDQLLASVTPAQAATPDEAPFTEADKTVEPKVSPLPAEPPTTTPDTPPPVSSKAAAGSGEQPPIGTNAGQKLHARLGAILKPVTVPADFHDQLAYMVTKGRTTHLSEMTDVEAGLAVEYAEAVTEGHYTVEGIRTANDEHRAQLTVGVGS